MYYSEGSWSKLGQFEMWYGYDGKESWEDCFGPSSYEH